MRTCPDCGKYYSNRSSLWLHQRLNHGGELASHPKPYKFKGRRNDGDDDDGFNSPYNFEEQEGSGARFSSPPASPTNESDTSIDVSDCEHESEDLLSDKSASEEDTQETGCDVFGEIDAEDLTTEEEDSCSEDEIEGEGQEEEEEFDMSQESKKETYIRWPISKAYRISLPWTYWGSIPKIKKHRGWINRIYEKENSTIIYNIKRALDGEIATLFEISYNCLHYRIPIEKYNFSELRKKRQALRLLADPSVSIEDKRDCILLYGADFVNSIIHCIEPLIENKFLKTIEVYTDGDEEEEDV